MIKYDYRTGEVADAQLVNDSAVANGVSQLTGTHTVKSCIHRLANARFASDQQAWVKGTNVLVS